MLLFFLPPLATAIMAIMLYIPSAQGGGLSESQVAPNFSLPNLSGKIVSLSDFRGSIVLVDFWATWCIPCRKTLPELSALDKKYRGHGAVVLGLSVDNPDSFDNQYLINFIEKVGVTYPVLRADQPVIDTYLGKEQPAIPTLFILDKTGRIAKIIEGQPEGKLEAIVDQLIRTP